MRICFDRLCFAKRRPAGEEDQLPQLQDIAPVNNHHDIATIPFYKDSINALDPPNHREYYRCASAIESISAGTINNNITAAITTPPVTSAVNSVAKSGGEFESKNANKSDKSVLVNGSDVIVDVSKGVVNIGYVDTGCAESSELTNPSAATPDTASKMQQEPNLNIQMQPDLRIINNNPPPGVLPANLLLTSQSGLVSGDPHTINFLQQQQHELQQRYQHELAAHLLQQQQQQLYPSIQQQQTAFQPQLQQPPLNHQPQIQSQSPVHHQPQPQSPVHQPPSVQPSPTQQHEPENLLPCQPEPQTDSNQGSQQVSQQNSQDKSFAAPPPGFEPHHQQTSLLQQQHQFNNFTKNLQSLSNQMQTLRLNEESSMNAVVVNNSFVPLTPKDHHYLQLINIRDLQIQELQKTLRAKDNEIAELKSHLDKFQSVFPFSRSPGPVPSPGAVGVVPGARKSGHVFPRQRAQGISAEPQSESLLELLHVTFPKYDKDER